jgi:UDP-2,3-diacylglucosamine pyrophosphatase LpxH
MRAERPYNLLALSDLHLGCDLKSGAPHGEDPRRGALDLALVRFLDHHAVRREGGKPWRLLLVGDVFDFVAVTLTPGAGRTAPFEVRDEERAVGLSSEEEKCAWKLSRIAARHEWVFHALARFLAAGHEVHFVRGNHDAELHWPGVQAELRRLLCRRAGVDDDARSQRELEERVQFHAWFYLEPGLLYAEHGNAHDRYCLQSGFFDERPEGGELELPMSSKVIRHFANAWAHKHEDLEQADKWGAIEFVGWVLRMGNPLRIAVDYFAMVLRVLRPIALRRRRGRAQSAEEQRLVSVRRWLARYGVAEEPAARQLLALASRPAEQSLFDAAQLFYVDRMLLALASLAVAAAGAALARWPLALLWPAASVALFAACNYFLARRRRTDAHLLLLAAARRLGALLDVRWLIMGHSHGAVDQEVCPGVRYLNLGSWSPADGRLPHAALIGERAELRWFDAGLLSQRASAAPPAPAPRRGATRPAAR